VCKALGLANPTVAVQPLREDEKAKSDLGYGSPANIISESGLYKLVLRADKPEARTFQDWVTREVLPAIRKDGAYIQGEEKVRTGDDAPVLPAHHDQARPCRDVFPGRVFFCWSAIPLPCLALKNPRLVLH
jgi:prophage antirepressor-like protein